MERDLSAVRLRGYRTEPKTLNKARSECGVIMIQCMVDDRYEHDCERDAMTMAMAMAMERQNTA